MNKLSLEVMMQFTALVHLQISQKKNLINNTLVGPLLISDIEEGVFNGTTADDVDW